jgi:hypothetical protein
MPKTIDADFEATVARAMLAELNDYLQSDVVFWQPKPNALGERMPKLTIGGLLEALLRAEVGGAGGIAAMRAELEAVKTRHRDRYLRHAEQETRSRLDTWSWYLEDVRRAPADAAGYYANEVRARLKAELLLAELERERRGGAERRRATALDAILRDMWQEGEFIWDERLKPVLPATRYGWLYGRPGDK